MSLLPSFVHREHIPADDQTLRDSTDARPFSCFSERGGSTSALEAYPYVNEYPYLNEYPCLNEYSYLNDTPLLLSAFSSAPAFCQALSLDAANLWQ